MKKQPFQNHPVFALLFFVLAVVLFVQAVLGSILFDFNYTETLVMLGAVFAGLVLLALWRIIDLLEADRKQNDFCKKYPPARFFSCKQVGNGV